MEFFKFIKNIHSRLLDAHPCPPEEHAGSGRVAPVAAPCWGFACGIGYVWGLSPGCSASCDLPHRTNQPKPPLLHTVPFLPICHPAPSVLLVSSKPSQRGTGLDMFQLCWGHSPKAHTGMGHGQVAATMASRLGRGTRLASPSLLEPTSLSLSTASLPETCCTPREVGPKIQWQGHWESLQLGLWLRGISPQLQTHSPGDGGPKAHGICAHSAFKDPMIIPHAVKVDGSVCPNTF